MHYSEARYIADSVIAKLVPVTERCLIAGSIRRKQKECSDIDIVVQPRRDDIRDMFNNLTGKAVIPEFVATVNQWTKLKGEPTGKYTQRLFNGAKVELSITSPENWGNIVLIRTGNADFSHMIMKRVLKLGFEQKDGFLYSDDKIIPLYEEQDYFRVLNLPYIQPENRDAQAFARLRS